MLQTSLIACFITLSSAAYVIQDDYEPSTFANQFDFFTDTDPTEGYVNYIDQSSAEQGGLYRVEGDQVFIGVDSTNVASGRGRDSVRISSKASYNHGLFVLDLAHMPGGQCGSWPAFWLLGPNWPNGGEVDIIEGVNSQRSNKMTLHTSSGCTITNRGQFSGQLAYENCDINAPDQPYNTGCGINTTRDDSYGTGFNAIGGGVYATEWTSDHFAIWFFPRSAIPADITSGNPNPENWGLPTSEFSGNCDIDAKFQDQQIIFDITFCGVWAGYDWNFDTSCNTRAPTCNDYVQNNPSAFTETHWRINSLKVYQENGAPLPTTTTTTTRTSSLTTLSSSLTTLTTSTTTFQMTSTTLSINPSVTSISTTNPVTNSTTTTISVTNSTTTSNPPFANTTTTGTPPFANTTTTSNPALTNVTTTSPPSQVNATSTPPSITDDTIIVTITITSPSTQTLADTTQSSNIPIPTDLPSIITFTTVITSCPPNSTSTSILTSTNPTANPVQTALPDSNSDNDGSWYAWSDWNSSWRARRKRTGTPDPQR